MSLAVHFTPPTLRITLKCDNCENDVTFETEPTKMARAFIKTLWPKGATVEQFIGHSKARCVVCREAGQ